MRKIFFVSVIFLCCIFTKSTFAYTHADTLRGSNGRGRSWWDVQKYVLKVAFDIPNRSIAGYSFINFDVVSNPNDSMQVDLQQPMQIDSICFVDGFHTKLLNYAREGNVIWVFSRQLLFRDLEIGGNYAIIVYYNGKPREATNPPWDGGFSWKTDSLGNPWVAVSCQGLGASVWWPCKDAQWDEPDKGMDMHLIVKKGLQAISNGRLVDTTDHDGQREFHWHVENPINNYDVTFYIGEYTHWSDTIIGEKGPLTLDFWVLKYNEARARIQFQEVKTMLHCFEYWLGPYPFYEDGYKLVDAPYLGMEHQSAIAYGNKYKMGYLGMDRTGSGYGKNFDYIIVHESGHEWFGNSITARDIADNWIHEGITTYSESLYVECTQGKEKADKYRHGERMNIFNDKPVIGDYGVNNEGANDMYEKGATMMSMIRVMMHDDEKFRMMLRSISANFYHMDITTSDMEDYIQKFSGLELAPFFDQYLRTATIPKLEYYVKDGKLNYRFTNIVAGFTLPLTATSGDYSVPLQPTAAWASVSWTGGNKISTGKDYLIRVIQYEQ